MRTFKLWMVVGALLGVAAQSAHAQRRVTGRVTATTGEPLSAASVTVLNTTIGTYTDQNGQYTLSIPGGPQSLVVRRIGYRRTVAAVAAGATEVNIQAEKDVLSLETMVVTGTTTQISSANAPNAVAVVSAQTLTEVPTPTVENALQGKIPGAVITQNSGAPGGGMQVQMRGVTSINATSSPLYVVDGVIVSNAQISNGLNSITQAGGGINSSQDQMVNRIADLNPDDIESIEVLKGASAGAIYGSKASNGVIVITTKRGNSGTPDVNVTQRLGSFSISHELGLRCFPTVADATNWWASIGGSGTPPGIAAGTAASAALPCNNFEDQFYTPTGGPSYETDVNVRGGNAATTYYIGGLAKRDNAIQQGSYYQKQSITANIGQLIGSRINIRANNQFIHDLTDRGVSGNDNNPVVSPGDIFSSTPTYFPLNQSTGGVFLPNPFVPDNANPFQDAALITEPEDVFRYIGSLNTTLSAYASQRQTFDVTFIGGLDTYNYNAKVDMPPTTFIAQTLPAPGTIVENKTTSVFANLNLSGVHKYTAQSFSATTSFGLRNDYRQADQLLNQGKGFPPGVTDVNLGLNQASSESNTQIKDFSYYAQEEFLTLQERLLLTAAINAERSSVNGDANKYYDYPKFAASYRLPFTIPKTDEIKLRLAYGLAGNQPPYGFAFSTLPTGVYNGVIGARPSTIAGNPNIKPETSRELEGGADFTFLNGRAAFQATAFKKTVSDLILQAAVAPSSGFTTEYINGGVLQNTGTEFSLDVTPIQTKRLTWVSRITYARTAGNIKSMTVPCFTPGVGSFGDTFGSPWVCAGMSPSTLRFNNVDTIAGVATAQKDYLESAPRYDAGYSNTFTMGAFRLFAMIEARPGGYAVNLTNGYFDPALTLADTNASIRRDSLINKGYGVYVEPAGFVKLREVTLSYAVPNRWMQQVFPSFTHDVRIEVSGRNLKTWTKYTGYDPEVSNFSDQDVGRFQDVTPYPPSRSVFFSIGANF